MVFCDRERNETGSAKSFVQKNSSFCTKPLFAWGTVHLAAPPPGQRGNAAPNCTPANFS